MGILIDRMLWRARARHRSIGAAAIVFFCLAFPHGLRAQERPPVRRVQRDTSALVQAGRADSLRGPPGAPSAQPLDTATARKLGLPTAPSRPFPEPDSVMRALLSLPGYRAIRYAADSVVFHADTQSVDLVGRALVLQDQSTLEADTVRFAQRDCRLAAKGAPKVFQKGTVLVGSGMRYDTCLRRGYVDNALTEFTQSGVAWYLRGGLSLDSASVRLYAGHSAITSCDEPDPHYHFAAGKVKWISNTAMVARPAILYVRDIPVLWLPFIYQDMRPGRRSGILVPHFGINDIVRPNRGYRRHVSNVGYYFALNDYMDAQASMDWYAGNYLALKGEFRYRWLNRFLSGGLSISRMYESGQNGSPGGRSLRLQWGHQQNFDLKTKLTASVDYATSATVVERNAVDPNLATATLASNINFSKQFSWGALNLGASRRQDLTNGSITQTLPSFSLTPVPINLSDAVTWSPSISVSTVRAYHQQGPLVPVPPLPGDTTVPMDTTFLQSRTTQIQMATPLRIGRWTWQNSFSYNDQINDTRGSAPLVLADSTNPADTTLAYYGLNFSTQVDWNTSIGLPSLFPSSWKIQPSVGIQNTTSGAFLLKNQYTHGAFVHQGKRLSLSASVTPTFFGFFPGIGPLTRIRHSVSPIIQWSYAPSATVPEAYARALGPTAAGASLESPPQQRISIGLSQTFEGKFRPAPGDTSGGQNARKLKLLSLQTSAVTYDFEQAKLPGRTGWVTPDITNQFTSDLLPGFSISTTHDLWIGQVGTDTAKFSPFLSRVSARFSLSGSTITDLIGLLTGRGGEGEGAQQKTQAQAPVDTTTQPAPMIPGVRDRFTQIGEERPMTQGGHQPFTASITYDDQRSRDTTVATRGLTNRTLGLTFAFDPTPNWSLSWATQYNLTTKQFGQHVVRLERNLHRWKATFQFLKSPNGNFAFNFYISLLDQPDIKFQYQQQTLGQ